MERNQRFLILKITLIIISTYSFIDPENTFLGIFPKLTFKDKGSYEESGTKEFDRMAFKYLGVALFPLGIGYSIYSMIYNEHKGWYSFGLNSIYGFLLTFGEFYLRCWQSRILDRNSLKFLESKNINIVF